MSYFRSETLYSLKQICIKTNISEESFWKYRKLELVDGWARAKTFKKHKGRKYLYPAYILGQIEKIKADLNKGVDLDTQAKKNKTWYKRGYGSLSSFSSENKVKDVLLKLAKINNLNIEKRKLLAIFDLLIFLEVFTTGYKFSESKGETFIQFKNKQEEDYFNREVNAFLQVIKRSGCISCAAISLIISYRMEKYADDFAFGEEDKNCKKRHNYLQNLLRQFKNESCNKINRSLIITV